VKSFSVLIVDTLSIVRIVVRMSGFAAHVPTAGCSQENPIVLIDDETLASTDNEEVVFSHPWDEHE
jgi:hypothetical protein